MVKTAEKRVRRELVFMLSPQRPGKGLTGNTFDPGPVKRINVFSARNRTRAGTISKIFLMVSVAMQDSQGTRLVMTH
jgi:hypothetical protein